MESRHRFTPFLSNTDRFETLLNFQAAHAHVVNVVTDSVATDADSIAKGGEGEDRGASGARGRSRSGSGVLAGGGALPSSTRMLFVYAAWKVRVATHKSNHPHHQVRAYDCNPQTTPSSSPSLCIWERCRSCRCSSSGRPPRVGLVWARAMSPPVSQG